MKNGVKSMQAAAFSGAPTVCILKCLIVKQGLIDALSEKCQRVILCNRTRPNRRTGPLLKFCNSRTGWNNFKELRVHSRESKNAFCITTCYNLQLGCLPF